MSPAPENEPEETGFISRFFMRSLRGGESARDKRMRACTEAAVTSGLKAGAASAVAMGGVIVLAQNYVPAFRNQLLKYSGQPGSQYTGRLLLVSAAGLAGMFIVAEQSMLNCTRQKQTTDEARLE